MLAIISNSKGLGNRFEIRDKIAEINDSTKFSEEKLSMFNVVAELSWLVIGNSDFYKEKHI